MADSIGYLLLLGSVAFVLTVVVLAIKQAQSVIQQAMRAEVQIRCGQGCWSSPPRVCRHPHQSRLQRPLRLLLGFAERATGIAPSALTLADLDADLIGAFLQHLETERGNPLPPATRDACAALLLHLRRLPGTGRDRHDRRSPRDPRERAKTTHMSVPHHPRRGRSPPSLPRTPPPGSGAVDRLLLHRGIQTGLRIDALVSLRDEPPQPRIDTTGTSFWLGHANTQTTDLLPRRSRTRTPSLLERVPTLGQ